MRTVLDVPPLAYRHRIGLLLKQFLEPIQDLGLLGKNQDVALRSHASFHTAILRSHDPKSLLWDPQTMACRLDDISSLSLSYCGISMPLWPTAFPFSTTLDSKRYSKARWLLRLSPHLLILLHPFFLSAQTPACSEFCQSITGHWSFWEDPSSATLPLTYSVYGCVVKH